MYLPSWEDADGKHPVPADRWLTLMRYPWEGCELYARVVAARRPRVLTKRRFAALTEGFDLGFLAGFFPSSGLTVPSCCAVPSSSSFIRRCQMLGMAFHCQPGCTP